MKIDEDFVAYCKTLTDAQLEEVIKKEWKANRRDDYASAVVAAALRGWLVKDGQRQADQEPNHDR